MGSGVGRVRREEAEEGRGRVVGAGFGTEAEEDGTAATAERAELDTEEGEAGGGADFGAEAAARGADVGMEGVFATETVTEAAGVGEGTGGKEDRMA